MNRIHPENMPAEPELGFIGKMVRNIRVSFRLTIASFKLVFAYPKVLLLPLLTLGAIAALVIIPLSIIIWGIQNHPQATGKFFETLYFVTVAAARNENMGLAISSAIVETYILWSLWMIPVLTSVLYFITVGMHVATQQIQRREPNLGEAFGVANRNLWRIVALAAFIATVYTWTTWLVYRVIGAVPIVGRWIMRGVKLILTAVTYLMLPIVIYERAGAKSAFKSAWNNVKKTWSGLMIGTGFVFVGMWVLSEVFIAGIAKGVLGLEGWSVVILSIILAGATYALSTAVGAALRATLYWYATTGQVPPGFDESDLPKVAQRTTFTGVPMEEVIASAK